MFQKRLDPRFGPRKSRIPLALTPLPIQEFPWPDLLRFTLSLGDGLPLQPLVKAGDEIKAGQALGKDGSDLLLPSPVSGKIVALTQGPDLRGAPKTEAVLIKPMLNSEPAFSPLDPEEDPLDSLGKRIRDAGVVTDAQRPKPLMAVIKPENGTALETLIVQAMDREPGLQGATQLFRERTKDVGAALSLLQKLSGARKILLATPQQDPNHLAGGIDVETLPVPATYPDCLEPLVALRAGGGVQIRVVALETALAALDAVRLGKVQDTKVITLIGPDNIALGNFRVPLGLPLGTLLAENGLEPLEGDKIVAGGSMRGFAQYSPEASIDAGVDGVLLIRADSIVDWSDEPCVNCGTCVEVCPVNLQVPLIGRYAEFERFHQAENLGLFHCIECGMCAAFCTGRRPLVQWIQLAKKELLKEKAAKEQAAREAEAGEIESDTETVAGSSNP
ncbi:MAG: 4Fe-4S dicluster domain-containing protein [Planctomycetes bacterium]|nr:4Fe-4S dicluster domain-containing protein [Planctomycetota bacterium]